MGFFSHVLEIILLQELPSAFKANFCRWSWKWKGLMNSFIPSCSQRKDTQKAGVIEVPIIPMGKHAALCSLPSPIWAGWGSAYLFSSEPWWDLFPRGIIHYSNIHKTKVILHPPPGPATKSTSLSKQITKLHILGITLVSGLTFF